MTTQRERLHEECRWCHLAIRLKGQENPTWVHTNGRVWCDRVPSHPAAPKPVPKPMMSAREAIIGSSVSNATALIWAVVSNPTKPHGSVASHQRDQAKIARIVEVAVRSTQPKHD